MSQQDADQTNEILLLSRIAHVVERAGLAVAGAMCGTFVAAQLTRLNPMRFDSIGFIAAMILVGMIGFYLGVDIPRLGASPASPATARPRVDPVELLSAGGTFLATIAALIALYAFVFDEVPQPGWGYMFACWWLLGVAMQIGAGVAGRLSLVKRAAG